MIALLKTSGVIPPKKTGWFGGDDDWWYRDYRDPNDGFNWIGLLLLLILTLVAWITITTFAASAHNIKEMNDLLQHQHYPYSK